MQAATSSGDVELDFRLAPRDVDAATASGDVDVSLPRGETYRVEADTGSGDSAVGVHDRPGRRRASCAPARARATSTVGYGN